VLRSCLSANRQSLNGNEVRSLLATGTGRKWDSDKIKQLVDDIDADDDGSIGEMEFLHNAVQWTPVIK
jgi:Ca2+-binding EF-hand superfamily protein